MSLSELIYTCLINDLRKDMKRFRVNSYAWMKKQEEITLYLMKLKYLRGHQ